MFLFKSYFVDAILNGPKTQTRRFHKRARAKVGSIHQCRTTLFGLPFAHIKILRVWQEKLEDISQEDVYAEGLDMTKEEFIEGFMEIQPKALPDTLLYCYEFKVVNKGVS